MDRVFLDANVLYSSAYKPASPLRRLWDLAQVELWSSEAAVAEALGNLREDRPAQVAQLHKLIARLKLQSGTAEEVALPDDVTLPADDRLVLCAAIQAQATHFLTGDKSHFGPYFGLTIGGVFILPPSDFLRVRPPPDPQE